MNDTTIQAIASTVLSAGFGWLLLWSLSRCQFDWLARENRSSQLLACIGIQFLLWQIRISLPGFELHLLGATVMTLMFGWEFALLGGAVTLNLHAVMHSIPLSQWGMEAWSLLAAPIATSYILARSIQHYLPRHFYVYVFLCAFAGGALSMFAHALLSQLFFHPAVEFEGIAPLLPSLLMMFAEGFFSGGMMTLMVVYRPQWVVSFRDELYAVAPRRDVEMGSKSTRSASDVDTETSSRQR